MNIRSALFDLTHVYKWTRFVIYHSNFDDTYIVVIRQLDPCGKYYGLFVLNEDFEDCFALKTTQKEIISMFDKDKFDFELRDITKGIFNTCPHFLNHLKLS